MTRWNEYEKQADDMLRAMDVAFSVQFIGSDCPGFCKDAPRAMGEVDNYPRKAHIHGKHYRCTFSRGPADPLIMDFWNSYADEELLRLGTRAYRTGETLMKFRHNEKPMVRAYDVWACMEKSDPGTFSEFCAEFGYDEDSRRAEAVWRACIDEWTRVSRFFTAPEIEQLQEVV